MMAGLTALDRFALSFVTPVLPSLCPQALKRSAGVTPSNKT